MESKIIKKVDQSDGVLIGLQVVHEGYVFIVDKVLETGKTDKQYIDEILSLSESEISEWKGYVENGFPSVEFTEADLQAQKEREAEQEARQIAIEEIIAERTQQALDNVKNEIAKGKITDARKAVRDEHKKLKG